MHWYGFFQIFVLKWCRKLSLSLKTLLHMLDLNGQSSLIFSSVCLQMFFRIRWFKKNTVTTLNGNSPLCIFIWELREVGCEKKSSQMLHLYVLSPVCVPVPVCLLRFTFYIKPLVHWLHLYCFSPGCVLICLLRFTFYIKPLVH